MTNIKKKFHKVYVIDNSSKLAYITANRLSINSNNFYFIQKKEDLIKKCSFKSLILISDSFSKKNKDYEEIQKLLKSDSFSSSLILTEKEFKERAYTAYKKN